MQLTVDIRAEALLARLRGTSQKLSETMRRVITRLSIQVQAAVKDKLTGKVLHVRTGTLRRSINRVVTQQGDDTTASIGTNVAYAGIHEYGFNGTVTVKAFQRKTPNGAVANVREHSRHIVMPERSFLRSTLREWQPRITSELRQAALEGMRP